MGALSISVEKSSELATQILNTEESQLRQEQLEAFTTSINQSDAIAQQIIEASNEDKYNVIFSK